MVRIAILASGSGSNAEAIIRHFNHHPSIEVAVVMSNRPSAYVLKRAEKAGIPTRIFSRSDLDNEGIFTGILTEYAIDYLVLAGFLLLIPAYLTRKYEDRILNIHPALLPAYGGKGMYGHHVHEAVHRAGDKRSGMTIHLVNEKYDEGRILFQDSVAIEAADTPGDIASRVLELEHLHYAPVIESYISGREGL